eukprot:1576347-Karenia_brevis.AAC.1
MHEARAHEVPSGGPQREAGAATHGKGLCHCGRGRLAVTMQRPHLCSSCGKQRGRGHRAWRCEGHVH